jgi:hypothetical protein
MADFSFPAHCQGVRQTRPGQVDQTTFRLLHFDRIRLDFPKHTPQTVENLIGKGWLAKKALMS